MPVIWIGIKEKGEKMEDGIVRSYDLYVHKSRGACVRKDSLLYKIIMNKYRGMYDTELMKIAISNGMETNLRPFSVERIAYFLAIGLGLIYYPKYTRMMFNGDMEQYNLVYADKIIGKEAENVKTK